MDDAARPLVLVALLAVVLPVGLAVLFMAGRPGFVAMGVGLILVCVLVVLRDRDEPEESLNIDAGGEERGEPHQTE